MSKSASKLLLPLAIFLLAFLLLQVEHSADPERMEELGCQNNQDISESTLQPKGGVKA